MAKILVFYQYYCTPKGSWGTRYYEFSRRWAEAGHDVTIVTSVYDKSDLKPTRPVSEFHIEGVRVIALKLKLSNKHGRLRRLWTFLAYAALASWHAVSANVDVIVASSGPITVGVPGLLGRWLRRRKLVFEVRDLWPEGAIQLGRLRNPLTIRAARAFERLCYRNANAVVALSPGMAEGIRAVVPNSNIVTIPNAADLDLFYPDRAIPESVARSLRGRFLVLYAGTLGAANNGMEIVGMARELQLRGAHDVMLAVIGDGSERQEMQRQISDMNLQNVEFLGLLPKLRVADWHAAASVILCGFKPVPVMGTASPNKLFDGLAGGCVILNNTMGWMADLLQRAGCGYSYEAGDVARAADIIVQLRDNPGRRAEMQAAAHKLAVTEFSRDALAARFEELLRG